MDFDRKSEILFVLILIILLPTFYDITEGTSSTRYKTVCTPVIYVDAGIPGEDVGDIVRDDEAICKTRCQGYCMVQIGSPCKGVYKAYYSYVYGVSCACELFPVDKDLADDCVDPKRYNVETGEEVKD